MRMRLQSKIAAAVMLLLSLWTTALWAAPEAHILRIDPRASQTEGAPVLTTVIDLVQNKRMIDALGDCARSRGDALLDCESEKLEQGQALYTPIAPFPDAAALFTITVDGVDRPTTLASKARWGESLNQPDVGTAWLILVDASSSMGTRFDDAKAIAKAFIGSMTQNDIVDVAFFSDHLVSDTKWQPAAAKTQVTGFLDSLKSTYPSSSARPLNTIIQKAVSDTFGELGNVGNKIQVPLHQAMVVLSNGSAGGDVASTGSTTQILNQFFTKGRFPEDNTVLPKTPLPVISIWLPLKGFEVVRDNAQQFMEGLANPEIGGFYDTIRQGTGPSKAPKIVNAVRTRFNQMYIVKWRVSCIAPTMTQSFKLAFTNASTPIAGDATFSNVPIGIDPKAWPLDINADYTKQMADREPLQPGAEFTIYGNFCWGGDTGRAEVYFVPSGSQLPAAMAGNDINAAQQARQHLIASKMNGRAVQTSDGNVRFQAPDNEKMLWGSGKNAVVRLVVYDSKAFRASGVTANTVLTLKGAPKSLPLLYIVGGAFGAVVVALLGVLLLRGGGGGGGGRRRSAGPAPAPVVAGGGAFGGGSPIVASGPGGMASPMGAGPSPVVAAMGFSPMGAPPMGAPPMGAPPMGAPPMGPPSPMGVPMGAMGAPPMGSPSPMGAPLGGMGAPPMGPPSPMGATPMSGAAAPGGPFYGGAPLGAPPFAPNGVPGQPPGGTPNADFMYGGSAPQYGLTNAQPAQAPMPPDPYGQVPPPDPYAQAPMPVGGGASRATLSGSAGVYGVTPGVEMLAGRDTSRCQIALSEPRVSGVHARLKMENGQLYVVDEQSNNGTFVDGQRLSPQMWTPVTQGSIIRFGPVEFSVRLE